MLSTRFTETFGVCHPVVQGGMQWVGRAELAAAVSAAGGLGVITALTQPTPADLVAEVARAFVCTAEAPVHDRVKRAIVAASERDTELIFRSLHNTARVARNSISQQVVRILADGGEFADVRELVSGARGRTVFEAGDTEAGIWTAGLAQGLIDDIPPVAELMARILDEAAVALRAALNGFAPAPASAGEDS